MVLKYMKRFFDFLWDLFFSVFGGLIRRIYDFIIQILETYKLIEKRPQPKSQIKSSAPTQSSSKLFRSMTLENSSSPLSKTEMNLRQKTMTDNLMKQRTYYSAKKSDTIVDWSKQENKLDNQNDMITPKKTSLNNMNLTTPI